MTDIEIVNNLIEGKTCNKCLNLHCYYEQPENTCDQWAGSIEDYLKLDNKKINLDPRSSKEYNKLKN